MHFVGERDKLTEARQRNDEIEVRSRLKGRIETRRRGKERRTRFKSNRREALGIQMSEVRFTDRSIGRELCGTSRGSASLWAAYRGCIHSVKARGVESANINEEKSRD